MLEQPEVTIAAGRNGHVASPGRLAKYLLQIVANHWQFVYCMLVLGLVFFPLFIIVIFSFNGVNSTVFPPQALSLRWYKELFGSWEFVDGIQNSLVVAFASSLSATALGTLCSFGMERFPFKLKGPLSTLLQINMMIPGLLLGIALLSYFVLLHVRLSLYTVIISHTVCTVPFVVVSVQARLRGFDFALEEAARDLGATSWQAFWKVTLPLVKSSIIGAALLAFAISFDEFPVTFFTIGTQHTLPLLIWSMLRRGISPTINAISAIVLLVSITLISLANKYGGLQIRI